MSKKTKIVEHCCDNKCQNGCTSKAEYVRIATNGRGSMIMKLCQKGLDAYRDAQTIISPLKLK